MSTRLASRPAERHVSTYASCPARSRPPASSAGAVALRRADLDRGGRAGRGIGGVVLLGDSWLQLLMAAALAGVLTQCAFLGHDGAHRQIFRTLPGNEWAGRLFAGLFAGLSLGWWVGKHSRHHRAPNQIGVDADIDSKVLALTEEAAGRRRGVLRWVAIHQGWLFFPLLLLEGVNLHVDSMRTAVGPEPLKRRWSDIALISLHWGGYLTFLLAVMPPTKAAAFVAVDLAVFGVWLGGAFAPNHIGMPVLPKAARLDFLNRQVLMSRNVSGGNLITFLMGGLNHQVEHHLFPSMPRPNLKRAQPLVEAFCAEQGIPYTQTSLLGAYRAIVNHLHGVGLRAREPFSCPLVRTTRG